MADLNASGATQRQRDEWKRLAEAATPGPWEADIYACDGTDCGCPVEGWGRVLRDNREHIVCDSPCRGEDVRFIVAAREAVPALIAEVESLTVERDALAQENAAMARERAELVEMAEFVAAWAEARSKGDDSYAAVARLLRGQPTPCRVAGKGGS